MSGRGGQLPKFGDWDVKDPATSDGFTVIFTKARDEKKSNGTAVAAAPAPPPTPPHSPKKSWWPCCF